MVDNPSLFRDGYVLPAEGYRVFETGAYANRVPLVIGTNADEVKLFQFFDRSLDWRGKEYAAAARFGSDRWKADGVDAVARRLSVQPGQPPVYAYHFRWGSLRDDGTSVLPGPWGRRLGSFHSLEIPFFLGTDTVDWVLQVLLFSRKNAPGRRALSDVMMRFIARFIRTGDPNGDGLPSWPAWSNDDGGPKSLVLDADFDKPVVAVSVIEYTREQAEAALRTAVGDEVAAAIAGRRGAVGSDFASEAVP